MRLSQLPIDEVPFDFGLEALLLLSLLIAFVAIVLSIGDMNAARQENIENNPNFTAALQSLTSDTLRSTVLLAMFFLVTVRMADRELTGLAIVCSVVYTIVATSVIFLVNLYYRRRIKREAAVLIDPCADCPYEKSPLRHVAQRNRALAHQHPIQVQEDAEGVHITVSPLDDKGDEG